LVKALALRSLAHKDQQLASNERTMVSLENELATARERIKAVLAERDAVTAELGQLTGRVPSPTAAFVLSTGDRPSAPELSAVPCCATNPADTCAACRTDVQAEPELVAAV
jgi:hypothetical protein